MANRRKVEKNYQSINSRPFRLRTDVRLQAELDLLQDASGGKEISINDLVIKAIEGDNAGLSLDSITYGPEEA